MFSILRIPDTRSQERQPIWNVTWWFRTSRFAGDIISLPVCMQHTVFMHCRNRVIYIERVSSLTKVPALRSAVFLLCGVTFQIFNEFMTNQSKQIRFKVQTSLLEPFKLIIEEHKQHIHPLRSLPPMTFTCLKKGLIYFIWKSGMDNYVSVASVGLMARDELLKQFPVSRCADDVGVVKCKKVMR